MIRYESKSKWTVVNLLKDEDIIEEVRMHEMLLVENKTF